MQNTQTIGEHVANATQTTQTTEELPNVIPVEQEVEYRNGKKVYMKRVLRHSKKYTICKEVLKAIPEVATMSMEELKPVEKKLVKQLSESHFDGNLALSSHYVRKTVDEFRNGVTFGGLNTDPTDV